MKTARFRKGQSFRLGEAIFYISLVLYFSQKSINRNCGNCIGYDEDVDDDDDVRFDKLITF